MVKAMRRSPKLVCDGRRVFGAESMSRAVGKQAACMKSACVSVASHRGRTNRCIESARIPGQPMNPLVPLLGKPNTKVISNISQSVPLLGETNTQINQSGLPDETIQHEYDPIPGHSEYNKFE